MNDVKKKIYLLVYCLLTYIFMFLTIGSAKAQNTFIADNNFNAPTGTKVFSTIQAAVNAASPGDIIQVQPSPTTYGNVSINISNLTLMGIGFNVDKDIPLTSNMGDIILTNASDNGTDADGTIIKGLNFRYLLPGTNTGTTYLLENILVHNCQFQYIYNDGGGYSPIDGFEVRDCYITSSVGGYGIYIERIATNTIIRNNLLLRGIAFLSATAGSNTITNNILYDGIYVNAGSVNTKILNNNFIGATGTESAFTTELQNCDVSNNIFYGSTPSIATGGGSISTLFQNNTFSNNLVYSTGDDTMPPSGGGGGNIDGGGNVAGNPDFINVSLLNTWSTAYDFTLNGGSPAENMGLDGSDIGITGGLNPWMDTNFVLNTTSVPVIQILNTSTILNQNVDLPIRVKAYSN